MAAALDNVVTRSEKVNNSLINDEESHIKRVYDEKVLEYYASHAKTEQNVKKPDWSLDRISQFMKQIKESRVTTQKKSMDYYWLSKYDILETANEEYLIFKKKCVYDHTIRIIPMEKYFEILKEVNKNSM